MVASSSVVFKFGVTNKQAPVDAFKGVAKESARAAKQIERDWKQLQRFEDKVASLQEKRAKKIADYRIKENKRANAEIEKANKAQMATLAGAAMSVAAIIAGIAATGIGVAADVVGKAARDAMKLDERARQVAITGRNAGEANADPQEIVRSTLKIAAKHGMDAGDVMGGYETMLNKTGDASNRKYMETIATTAKATGASTSDVASVSADLIKAGVVKNVKDLQGALAALSDQGKKGSVTFASLAGGLTGVINVAKAAGYSSMSQQMQIGGIVQIAKAGSKSPEEALTASTDLLMEIQKHEKALHKDGVDIRGKDGKMVDPNELIAKLVATTGGPNAKGKFAEIEKIVGQRGMKALNPLLGTYNETFANTKGTDKEKQAAGYDALKKQLDEASGSTASFADVVQDAAVNEETSQSQMDAAWARVTSAVNDQVVPAFEAVLPQLLALGESALPTVVSAFTDIVIAASILSDWFESLGKLLEAMPGMGKSQKMKDIEAVKEAYTADRDKATEDRDKALDSGDKEGVKDANRRLKVANKGLIDAGRVGFDARKNELVQDVNAIGNPLGAAFGYHGNDHGKTAAIDDSINKLKMGRQGNVDEEAAHTRTKEGDKLAADATKASQTAIVATLNNGFLNMATALTQSVDPRKGMN